MTLLTCCMSTALSVVIILNIHPNLLSQRLVLMRFQLQRHLVATDPSFSSTSIRQLFSFPGSSLECVSGVLFCVLEMGYDRYKFTVQVIIGEQRGEGVK